MKSGGDELVKRHKELIHSERMKVRSHVQREAGEWVLNTLMVEGCDAPFRYRRRERYRSLAGQRVNLTYYRSSEEVGGIAMEIMKVVRVRIS